MQTYAVTDRLPPCGELVLAHTGYTTYRARWDGNDWVTSQGAMLLPGVITGWSPIPAPAAEDAI